MERLFEPSIQQRKEITKSKTTSDDDLGKTFLQGVGNYNKKTQRINETLFNLIRSNAIDSSIKTTLANLLNSSS